MWTKFDVSDYLSLREALYTAPPLARLKVVPHYDDRKDMLLLEMHFDADEGYLAALLEWAEHEGLGVLRSDLWSNSKRLNFMLEVYRFQSKATGALLAIARQLEERARAVQKSDPETRGPANLSSPDRSRLARGSEAYAVEDSADISMAIYPVPPESESTAGSMASESVAETATSQEKQEPGESDPS